MLKTRWSALTLVLVLAGGSRPARACEPTSELTSTFPAGGALPANAFAVFTGSFLGDPTELFTVRVEGQPVEFIVSQHLSSVPAPRQQLALRPLVPPPIGASWSVTFEHGQPKEVGSFTATAADELAPADPPASLHFDVHDFFSSVCSSCGSPAVNYWPQFAAGADDGGAPLVHALYVGHPDLDDDIPILIRRVGDSTPFHLAQELSWFADDQPVTEGVCFTLRLLDLAGNEAASALRTCKPCHGRIDPMQQPCEGFEPFEEPVWTMDELVPGGACAAEQAPPLPPEPFPEPEPDTTTGDSSTGDTGTSDPGTDDTNTGETTSTDTGASDSTGGDPTTSATSAPNPTGEEPTPTTSGATTSDPTLPGETTGSESSSDTAGETPDKFGCGCRGGESPPWALALLAIVGRRRRARI